jgi:arsenite-transporting ATPase
MLPLGRQRIVFVGGKGGVGKTTIASALAVSLAGRGERCLVVSTDPAHSVGDLFDARVGDREREILPNLWALEIDPEAQVERHLEAVGRSLREFVRPDMYHEIDRHLQLTRLSPGAVEAAMLERVADLMIEAGNRYERVVFDTAPTGHTLRLLSLPEIMSAWTDGLLRQRDRADAKGRALTRLGRAGDDLSYIDQADEQADPGAPRAGEHGDARAQRIRDTLLARRRTFTRARRLLLDPASTAFILVVIPERLPILESQKALEALRRFEVPVAGVVVNRVLPAGPLGEFLEGRRAQEAEYLHQIAGVFRGLPSVEVPLLPRDVHGVEVLRSLGSTLVARTPTPAT